jgi:hypothetical protein
MRTLDLGLDIVDGVGRLHLKGDSLAREGLDENLHDGDLDSGVVVVLSREEKKDRKEMLAWNLRSGRCARKTWLT